MSYCSSALAMQAVGYYVHFDARFDVRDVVPDLWCQTLPRFLTLKTLLHAFNYSYYSAQQPMLYCYNRDQDHLQTYAITHITDAVCHAVIKFISVERSRLPNSISYLCVDTMESTGWLYNAFYATLFNRLVWAGFCAVNTQVPVLGSK